MRTRWLVVALTVSGALNALLLVAWLRALQPPPVAPRLTARRPIVTNLLRPIRTNLVFQPRLLTWRDIESEAYADYVRNLRAIGCPEATVRDIIVADVDELFAARRLTEIPNPRREWWRSDPDPEVGREAAARRAALETERRELLTTLLGPGWDRYRLTARVAEEGNPLDGEEFGRLTEEARLKVRQIERRNAERRAALLAAATAMGGDPSPAELSWLQEETRAELATVLDPAQYEEYLLRYSQSADHLRSDLRGLDPTPEEFRRLFLAREGKPDVGQSRSGAAGDEQAAAATDAEREQDALVEQILGPAKYAHYRLNRDPEFQQLRSVAERAGLDAAQLIPLYQVNQAAREERERVLKNTELPAETQAEQLAELDKLHRASLRRLLGEERLERLEAAGLP